MAAMRSLSLRTVGVVALPLALALAGGWIAACSHSDMVLPPDDGSGGGGGAGMGGAGGASGLFDAGTAKALKVSPGSPVLAVERGVPGATVQFSATDADGQPVNAHFSLASSNAGTITNDGLFTANGKAGGEIQVIAENGGARGETTLTVNLHWTEGGDDLSREQKKLLGSDDGAADAAWTIVYPYDGSVFARGIHAPDVQFAAGALPAEKIYLHVVGPGVDYEGYFDDGQTLAMAQESWDAIGISSTGRTLSVAISKIAGGEKYGPLKQSWRVAKGSLHGSIYYNTYDSPLSIDPSTKEKNGAIMRIKGKSAEPEVVLGKCTVCHSVSADGSTAAAANYQLAPGGTFDLTGGGATNLWNEPRKAAFAAIYPLGGEVIVTNAAPVAEGAPNEMTLKGGPWTSELRKRDGTPVGGSGIEGMYAQTPSFSLDGKMLVFVDRSPKPPYTSKLALMQYDAAARKLSGYDVLATPPAGRHFSWPVFTPDGKYVVYQDGTGDDLSTIPFNQGKLYAIDVATRQVTYLAKLNGDGALPAGARDENLNFEPVFAPIASGGYYWLLFTSRRTYGNKLTADSSKTKRLWIAAFDVDAHDGVDPSHPAFYVPGQELDSANSRGFWAQDPCKKVGTSCEYGDECCDGFCNPKGDKYECANTSNVCSAEFDACKKSTDCCGTLQCIAGKCSQPEPPK
jgi:hypothetical protein